MIKPVIPTDEEDLPGDLTAVEKFAYAHDLRRLPPGQSLYQDLIPKTTPGPGQQYAFAVDLDKCTGCKACVTACHSENGLDADETWRSVGLVHGGADEHPVAQHITGACHHCLEPACLQGCPTQAYTKDPQTGIVKHLDDQCFGCQYCILKCPYDVPKYNKKRGIVHKCDMCIGRLDAGQAPACVRACPGGAIRISLVDTAGVRKNPQDYVKVPDAPASDYTFPTTRYTTKRVFPTNMEAVDYYNVRPEHAHGPLVAMLVLTQLSVGAFAAEFVLNRWMGPGLSKGFEVLHVFLALGAGLLALAASVFHLGRPHLAFRAFLGFRTSWLSREIVAFGAFANLAVIYALGHGLIPFSVPRYAVLAAGIAGVLCSVMVYRDTHRPFWDTHVTTAKFLMTAVILGFATIFLTSTLWGMGRGPGILLFVVQPLGEYFVKIILATTAFKLSLEAAIFLHLSAGNFSFLKKTAFLMAYHLRRVTVWRFLCGVTGGIFLPLLWIAFNRHMPPALVVSCAVLMFGALLAGELLERYLFFRAVVPLKMPGDRIC